MRRRVNDILRRANLDPVSVENPAHPGTPDINFVEGWIELKQLERWPLKAEALVAVRHFTPQQRVWLKRRYQANGNVWLLLQVGDEWLIFNGAVAAECMGRVTRDELYRVASNFWNPLNERGLLECLTSA